MKLFTRLSRLLEFKACDNCGTHNPPIYQHSYGDRRPSRVTLCCVKPGGFYGVHGHTKEELKAMSLEELEQLPGSNGKAIIRTYQFPITLNWRGWTGRPRR